MTVDRGRTAHTPTDIPAKGWRDILLRLKSEIAEDRVGLIAAGVAFYSMMAIFPGIAALMAVAGLWMEPSAISGQFQSLTGALPEEAGAIILNQAKEVLGGDESGLGLAAVLGFATALFSASKGVGSLVQGMNIAYDERETRGFIKVKGVVLALTVFLTFIAAAAFAATIALPALLSTVALGAVLEGAIQGISWLIAGVLVIFSLAVLYRWGPCRSTPKWRWVTPGAVAACILWILGTFAFTYYVRNFGSYNETFGALGGAIILLMWLWLSAFTVLLGAELDAEMEAQTRRDSTTGAAQPMGERGARKADVLGSKP